MKGNKPPILNPFTIAQAQLLDAMRDREARLAAWRQAVHVTHPTASPDFVRNIADDIMQRARLLSTQSILRFDDTAVFLLEAALRWVIRDGLPLDQIGGKMPKTLGDLGMLKLAEGGKDGGPLSAKEIQAVRQAKPNIIH